MLAHRIKAALGAITAVGLLGLFALPGEVHAAAVVVTVSVGSAAALCVSRSYPSGSLRSTLGTGRVCNPPPSPSPSGDCMICAVNRSSVRYG